jgi:hypothetical protein
MLPMMASFVGALTAREATNVTPPTVGIAPSPFNAPNSRATPVIISSMVCSAVATLALGMRVYARAKIQRRFELTDCEFDLVSFSPYPLASKSRTYEMARLFRRVLGLLMRSFGAVGGSLLYGRTWKPSLGHSSPKIGCVSQGRYTVSHADIVYGY